MCSYLTPSSSVGISSLDCPQKLSIAALSFCTKHLASIPSDSIPATDAIRNHTPSLSLKPQLPVPIQSIYPVYTHPSTVSLNVLPPVHLPPPAVLLSFLSPCPSKIYTSSTNTHPQNPRNVSPLAILRPFIASPTPHLTSAPHPRTTPRRKPCCIQKSWHLHHS